jgi:hypothetical protein
MLATDLAVTIGSRCGMRAIPVPILSWRVTAAAKESDGAIPLMLSRNGTCLLDRDLQEGCHFSEMQRRLCVPRDYQN